MIEKRYTGTEDSILPLIDMICFVMNPKVDMDMMKNILRLIDIDIFRWNILENMNELSEYICRKFSRQWNKGHISFKGQ
mgnify:CR=1 FL=1